MASIIQHPYTESKPSWLHHLIYNLAAGFIFAAVTLRTLLVFQGEPFLWQILVLLAVWLIAFILGSLPLQSLNWLAVLLTSIIAALPLVFLYLLQMDFFACLFTLVGMQSMRHFPPRVVWMLLGLATALVFLILMGSYGAAEALALALIYAAGSVFLAAYVWSIRQAFSIQDAQQALMGELIQNNHALELLAKQRQQLVAVRERQRLARELHDSVTQTIFSMTLTTQSALLLQKRDPQLVLGQLDRLDQLVRNAITEMQVLISHLAPEPVAGDNFVRTLQQHLEQRKRLDGLIVTLEIEGNQSLTPIEESSLFRIAQEALNNIIKHARVSDATLRLRLSEPLFMEIEDHGDGFDPKQSGGGDHLGLTGMRERAAEIGWVLKVESSPGQGTRIRVEKDQ